MKEGTRGHFPAIVAGDDLSAAILVFDFELKDHARRIVPKASFGGPVPLIVPSVTQYYPCHITGFLQHSRHVVGIVKHPLPGLIVVEIDQLLQTAGVVIGLGRCQHLVSHTIAIQVEFVKSQSTYPDSGRFYIRCRLKTLPEPGSGSGANRIGKLILPGSDPFGLPVGGGQETHLPAGCPTPVRCPSPAIPHPHLPEELRSGLQWFPPIGYVTGFVRNTFA